MPTSACRQRWQRKSARASSYPGYAGFRIPRDNYIFGRLTRGAGWYPDYQTRLLRVGAAHYDPARQVHEVVDPRRQRGDAQKRADPLQLPRCWRSSSKSSAATAPTTRTSCFEQGIRPKPQNYLLQPLRQFWWRFVTLKGYSDGLHGLRLSLLMAWYEFRKYLLLRGLWQERITRGESRGALQIAPLRDRFTQSEDSSTP